MGRRRPNADDGAYAFKPFSANCASFPSGHTTQAFVLASAISANYESPWVKVSSYSLASAVGMARIEQNAHHASDVFAGALIGTAIGLGIHHFNGPARADAKESSVKWVPWIDGEHTGVALNIAF